MKITRYAAGTTVTVESSKAELDALLGKHGVTQRGVMHDEEQGLGCVIFSLDGRRYRIDVPMPAKKSSEVRPLGSIPGTLRPHGWSAWTQDRRDAWTTKTHEQAVRERWRALVLLVKAKLEIVRMKASTFDREFLADLVLPDGQTAHQAVGQYMQKLIKDGYSGPLALPEAR